MASSLQGMVCAYASCSSVCKIGVKWRGSFGIRALLKGCTGRRIVGGSFQRVDLGEEGRWWFGNGENRAYWLCKAHHGAQETPLENIARRVQSTFVEVCVQNEGRPVAAALGDFCSSIVEAFSGRYSMERLMLELEFISGTIDGFRLTSSEIYYRKQWIDTVYIAVQMLAIVEEEESSEEYIENLRPWKPGDEQLLHIIQRTLKGTMTGEEQLTVKFDRALATKGASGGIASEKRTIAPQFVPVTQLVLLTKKVYIERMGI